MNRILIALCLLAVGALGRAEAAGVKARRSVAAWYEYREGSGIEELAPVADILDSVSVYGKVPPPEFIRQCHERHLTVYRLMPGSVGCFNTPENRAKTIEEFRSLCRDPGFDGIELDYEALKAEWRKPFNEFLQAASKELHRAGKKLCTTIYVPPDVVRTTGNLYDPKVIGRSCDEIRVMCYDLHMALGLHGEWAPTAPHVGFGPASTAPWAREAMRYWLERAPRAKLRMALPAYGNDYEAWPGGKGTQVYAPVPPLPAGTTNECLWLSYEKVHVYRYLDAENRPHIFYASDARSTRAHLATIDELNLPGLCFWNFHAVGPETWAAVREWLKKGNSAVPVEPGVAPE